MYGFYPEHLPTPIIMASMVFLTVSAAVALISCMFGTSWSTNNGRGKEAGEDDDVGMHFYPRCQKLTGVDKRFAITSRPGGSPVEERASLASVVLNRSVDVVSGGSLAGSSESTYNPPVLEIHVPRPFYNAHGALISQIPGS